MLGIVQNSTQALATMITEVRSVDFEDLSASNLLYFLTQQTAKAVGLSQRLETSGKNLEKLESRVFNEVLTPFQVAKVVASCRSRPPDVLAMLSEVNTSFRRMQNIAPLSNATPFQRSCSEPNAPCVGEDAPPCGDSFHSNGIACRGLPFMESPACQLRRGEAFTDPEECSVRWSPMDGDSPSTGHHGLARERCAGDCEVSRESAHARPTERDSADALASSISCPAAALCCHMADSRDYVAVLQAERRSWLLQQPIKASHEGAAPGASIKGMARRAAHLEPEALSLAGQATSFQRQTINLLTQPARPAQKDMPANCGEHGRLGMDAAAAVGQATIPYDKAPVPVIMSRDYFASDNRAEARVTDPLGWLAYLKLPPSPSAPASTSASVGKPKITAGQATTTPAQAGIPDSEPSTPMQQTAAPPIGRWIGKLSNPAWQALFSEGQAVNSRGKAPTGQSVPAVLHCYSAPANNVSWPIGEVSYLHPRSVSFDSGARKPAKQSHCSDGPKRHSYDCPKPFSKPATIPAADFSN
eukprot:jgi/Botrbrau1/23027/Bobra.136_1s0018.1